MYDKNESIKHITFSIVYCNKFSILILFIVNLKKTQRTPHAETTTVCINTKHLLYTVSFYTITVR